MSEYQKLLRVMSYNIRYDNPWDGQNRWSSRKDMVPSMVRFHRADVVGMQEVLKNQLDDLVERLPEYDYVGVGRDDGKDEGEFAAIFYLKDRLYIESKGYFWLSEDPEKPGILGWDAACVRMVTWVKFKDKITDKEYFHFNTHFDHVGQIAQKESSYLLLDRIAAISENRPVIVTGDFNCVEESAVYKILTGKEIDRKGFDSNYLKDAKYISLLKHHGPSATFMANFNPEKAWERIDYIFIKNGIKVIHHGTLSDHFDGKYSSDHMPVIADIVI